MSYLYHILQITTSATVRDAFGDNNEATKKVSRLLKSSGGRGKRKSSRKTAMHLLYPVCIDSSTRSH